MGWQRRKDTRYCSPRCKQSAYRERRYLVSIGLVEQLPLDDELAFAAQFYLLPPGMRLTMGEFAYEVPCDECARAGTWMFLVEGHGMPLRPKFLMFGSEDCLLDWAHARP